MNKQELKDALNQLDEEQLAKLVKNSGRTGQSREAIVNAFARWGEHDERNMVALLNMAIPGLDLKTEAEKNTEAAQSSARSACRSQQWAIVATIAAVVSWFI